MKLEEYIKKYKKLYIKYHELIEKINLDELHSEKEKNEELSILPDFWNNSENATKILRKISYLEKEINNSEQLICLFNEIKDEAELIEMGEDLHPESVHLLNTFSKLLSKFEVKKMLNGENDHLGAILSIHPGAGGTESTDWASML